MTTFRKSTEPKVLPRHLYAAVLRHGETAKPPLAKPVGGGFRWGDDLVITCAHVVDAALGLDEKLEVDEKKALAKNDGVQLPLYVDLFHEYLVSAKVVEYWPADDTNHELADIAILKIQRQQNTIPGLAEFNTAARLGIWSPDQEVRLYGIGVDDRSLLDWPGDWVKGRLWNDVAGRRVQIECFGDEAKGMVLKGFSGGAVYDAAYTSITGLVSARNAKKNYAYLIPAESLTAALQQHLNQKITLSNPQAETAQDEVDILWFLDRQQVMDVVQKQLDQHFRVIPIVLQGTEDDGHEEAAKRLLFVKENDAKADRLQWWIRVPWPSHQDRNATLHELRKSAMSKLWPNNQLDFSQRDWVEGVGRFMQPKLQPAKTRVIIHVLLDKEHSHKNDLPELKQFFKDWLEIARAARNGRFIFIVSVVYGSKSQSQSWGRRWFPFLDKPLCEHSLLDALTLCLGEHAGQTLDAMKERLGKQAVMQLEPIQHEHLTSWIKMLCDDYAYEPQIAERLGKLVAECLERKIDKARLLGCAVSIQPEFDELLDTRKKN